MTSAKQASELRLKQLQSNLYLAYLKEDAWAVYSLLPQLREARADVERQAKKSSST